MQLRVLTIIGIIKNIKEEAGQSANLLPVTQSWSPTPGSRSK